MKCPTCKEGKLISVSLARGMYGSPSIECMACHTVWFTDKGRDVIVYKKV